MPAPAPRRRWLVGALLVVIVAAGLWWAGRLSKSSETPVVTPSSVPSSGLKSAGAASSAPSPAFGEGHPSNRLLGENILSDYGNVGHPPEEDLIRVAHLLENFAVLVKGDNPLPLGANEEIAAAVRGRNRVKLRMLPDRHAAFNDQGQIVDRWGTPLYFHARSRDRIDIRSAGPDRVMWTEDDLHRQPEGRFLRGPSLLAPSLFDESAPPGSRK